MFNSVISTPIEIRKSPLSEGLFGKYDILTDELPEHSSVKSFCSDVAVFDHVNSGMLSVLRSSGIPFFKAM